MRRSSLLASSLLTLAMSSMANAAGTVTGQLGIQLIVTDGCTVGNGNVGGSFGTIDFGSVAAITTTLEAQSVGSGGGGSFSVTCNTGTSFSVTLDSGINAAGGTQRNMTNGTDAIAYNLFQDAGRTTPWGNGSNGGDTLTTTGTGVAQELVVYGQVPPRTAVPSVGTYTDTVQVTVAW